MIPRAEVSPVISQPLPTCEMPGPDEITEEGFGWFRGTWWIGRVPLDVAEEVVRYEAELVKALDSAASNPEEFEVLARSVESGETDELDEQLAAVFIKSGLRDLSPAPDDAVLLGGLEVGVAGLAHVLSMLGCPTAASCRSHTSDHSWSDCPVVFFAARPPQVSVLADLASTTDCGMDSDRGMLKIYAPSIIEMHALARLAFEKRGQLDGGPETRSSHGHQLRLDET